MDLILVQIYFIGMKRIVAMLSPLISYCDCRRTSLTCVWLCGTVVGWKKAYTRVMWRLRYSMGRTSITVKDVPNSQMLKRYKL